MERKTREQEKLCTSPLTALLKVNDRFVTAVEISIHQCLRDTNTL